MKPKKNGYIKVSRSFLHSDIYQTESCFNLKEVYLDLNLRALYADRQKYYRNKLYPYRRGQVEGSLRQFADWWNMNKDTAERRLKNLEENGYIFIDEVGGRTVITLRHYCTEQDFEGLGSDTNTDSNSDSNSDSDTDNNTDSNSDNYKKVKESTKKDSKNKRKPSADFDVLWDGVAYEE